MITLDQSRFSVQDLDCLFDGQWSLVMVRGSNGGGGGCGGHPSTDDSFDRSECLN